MNKAIFLDRDGTINVDKGYVHKIKDFQYIDGVIEALKLFTTLGYIIIVVTNQSGIARGYYTDKDLEKLNKWMISDLREKGVVVSKVYYCPHLPEAIIWEYRLNCQCRKPKTGLFWKAKQEFDINMSNSYAIGDKMRDLAICKETDIKGILLKSKNELYMKTSIKDNIVICNNLLQAANLIWKRDKGKNDE